MRSRAILMLVPLLLAAPVSGQQTSRLGIEASGADSSRPTVAHWQDLIGDWDVVFEALDATGSVVATYDAEWNFFYVLDGAAVQDVFFLPPRDVAGADDGRYVGTGLRVVDPDPGDWRSSWTDTDLAGLETWEGTSEPGHIRFHRMTDTARVESIYWVDDTGRFRWEQRERAEGGDWIVTQRATGNRRTD